MTETQRYPIPAGRHRTEEEIKRSRFITSLAWTPTVDAARDFVREVSDEFSDASHNCWAHVVGPPGSTAHIGMSDAGEPHGTAGRPMLTVLLHSNVGDISAVVTRYFGGTLLGKGGLVRAYSGGVKLALGSLPTVEKIPMATVQVMVDYAAVTPLQMVLPQYEAESEGEDYAVDVTFRIKLPEKNLPSFARSVTDLTNGNAILERVE